MGIAEKNNTRNKQAVTGLLALALLLCFVFLALFSEAFVLSHADHAHDHSGMDGSCMICVHLRHVENLLRQLTMSVAAAFFGFVRQIAAVAVLSSAAWAFGLFTPVALKTRLNH